MERSTSTITCTSSYYLSFRAIHLMIRCGEIWLQLTVLSLCHTPKTGHIWKFVMQRTFDKFEWINVWLQAQQRLKNFHDFFYFSEHWSPKWCILRLPMYAGMNYALIWIKYQSLCSREPNFDEEIYFTKIGHNILE